MKESRKIIISAIIQILLVIVFGVIMISATMRTLSYIIFVTFLVSVGIYLYHVISDVISDKEEYEEIEE